jgi:hypothetical protein
MDPVAKSDLEDSSTLKCLTISSIPDGLDCLSVILGLTIPLGIKVTVDRTPGSKQDSLNFKSTNRSDSISTARRLGPWYCGRTVA